MFQSDAIRTFCTTLVVALISTLSAFGAEHPYLKAADTPAAKAPAAPSPITAPPQAPLPAQIISAKKVFISNAGGEVKDWFNGGPNRLYNQVYAEMKEWGRYELVTTPADADLIFEVHAGGLYLAENEEVPRFDLTIYDPKTHVVLWAFAERLDWAFLKGHRDENFARGISRLVTRVKDLVEPPPPSATRPPNPSSKPADDVTPPS